MTSFRFPRRDFRLEIELTPAGFVDRVVIAFDGCGHRVRRALTPRLAALIESGEFLEVRRTCAACLNRERRAA